MIDASLSERLGSDHGWRELETKLRPFVTRRVSSAADADDVLQDVLSRILRGLPALRDDQRFGPWVYQVARNAIVDHRRTAARHPSATDEPPEAGADPPELEPPGDVEQALSQYAALLVSRLPPPYREALTLTELDGLTQRQAAERLGISLSGMKSRVQRGRRMVRAALEDCCRIALDSRRRVIACEPRRDGGATGTAC